MALSTQRKSKSYKREGKVLTESFFNRATLVVAQELIGKYLVRRHQGKTIALRISEVEAYDGPKDKASHAFRGRTPRTEIMFGKAGYLYVYFTYGMHYLVNVVTGPREYPAAVLIRAAGDIVGPARLTKALGIDLSLNKKKASKSTGLWFEDRGEAPMRLQRTPRIGVAYSGPTWSRRRYRFVAHGN
jgi:DNA-3-methyladenine glycosylase